MAHEHGRKHPEEPRPTESRWESMDATASSRRLARILSDADAMSDEEILALQRKFPGQPLAEVLVREGALSQDYLRGLLLRTLRMPWIDPEVYKVGKHLLDLLPESFCRKHRLLPVGWVREFLTVACVDPLDEETLAEVHYATSLQIRLVMCSEEQIQALIDRAFATEEGAAEPAGEGEEAGAPGGEAASEPQAPSVSVSSVAAELASRLSDQFASKAAPSAPAEQKDARNAAN